MMNTKNLCGTLLMACLTMFASCSSDDEDTQLATPTPNVRVTYQSCDSMMVAWSAMPGVTQYGYHIYSSTGVDMAGGVTTDTLLGVGQLQLTTDYHVQVKAFPKQVFSAQESAFTDLVVRTPFYPAVDGSATAYVSHLQTNVATVTNRGTMTEDRSAEGIDPEWYGTFTIAKFYGGKDKSLVFTVNRDQTIHILNGEGKDAEGRVCVLTGKLASLKVDRIYIDESSAVFDGPNRRLTFTAVNNGTGDNLRVSTTETITWAAPAD